MFGKRDPVCGARVGKDSEYFLEYGGKIYYFDSPACKATFQEDPSRFLGKKSREGFLTRRSNEVPRSCHQVKR